MISFVQLFHIFVLSSWFLCWRLFIDVSKMTIIEYSGSFNNQRRSKQEDIRSKKTKFTTSYVTSSRSIDDNKRIRIFFSLNVCREKTVLLFRLFHIGRLSRSWFSCNNKSQYGNMVSLFRPDIDFHVLKSDKFLSFITAWGVGFAKPQFSLHKDSNLTAKFCLSKILSFRLIF